MNKEDFTAKMTEVAGLLGMKVADPGHSYLALYLTEEEERSGKLWVRAFSFGASGGKMQVSGEYPRFDGQSCSPKDECPVGISLTKSAKLIAHDIERRVLPTYQENLKVAWERFDAWAASRERREQMMQRIARGVESNVSDRGIIFPSLPWSDFIYKIEPYGNDKVKLEITAPEDLAIKILGVVKAHAEHESNRVIQQSKEEG